MTSTDAELIARREQAMDRADVALNAAWPERKGAAYVRTMQTEAKELEAIAREMEAQGVEEVEQSRSWRYLGSVLSDLEPALGKSLLMKARDAYSRAEDLLESHGDALECAKLDFNFGNALRLMDPNNVDQLRDAERRFLSAQQVFSREATQYLPQIKEALDSTRSLLAIAPVLSAVEKVRADMAKLEKELAEGGDVREIAKKMKEVTERHGGPAGLFAAVQHLAENVPDAAKGGDKHRKLVQQMAKLTSLISGQLPADAGDRQILELLKAKLAEEAKAGRVSKARAAILQDVLGDFGRKMASGGDDIQADMSRLEGMRKQIAGQIAKQKYLSHGIDRPPEGSRAATLVERFWQLRRFVLEETNRSGKSEGERQALFDFNIRATKADRHIYEAGGDDAYAMDVDKEALRPLAVEIRRFAARNHPLLAGPIWGAVRAEIDTEAVLFSGSEAVGAQAAEACQQLGLKPLEAPKGENTALARWKQLQKAYTMIFDVGFTEGPDLAAVTYELGIARALGKPVVIVAQADRPVLFNIDLEPLRRTKTGDLGEMAEAIDQSLVWTMSSRPSGARRTRAHVLARYPLPQGDATVDQTLKQIGRLEDEPDPVALNDALQTLVNFQDDDTTMLIHPAWPPVYPEPGKARLFHVMPFGPAWADAVVERVAGVCAEAGVKYIRGDRVSERDVIRSIWDEISKATHVLVDLTGFNANVALELGMAHTIGRPTLMVGQGDTVKHLFPMIAKRRFYPYEDAESPKLVDAVRAFLA